MSVDNSKFVTSKSIAYNDLTLWDCIKSYPNIFSTYKGSRLQGGSLLCYVFMSAFIFLMLKWWTLSSWRTFIKSKGVDEKSPVRYWCISGTYQKYQHHSAKGHAGFVCQCFWSLWSGAASETKQKRQPFSRCTSALLYQHHRAAGLLMEGCQVVNCTMSHSTCSGVSSRAVSYYGNDLVSLSHHKWSPSLPLWWCHLYRLLCRGGLAPILTSVAGTTSSSSQGARAFWSGSWCERGRSGQNTSCPTSVAATPVGEGLPILFPSLIFPQKRGLMGITTSKRHHLPWCGCLVVVKCERKEN